MNCSITTLDFLSTAQEPPPLPCSRYRCTFLHPRTDISSLISPRRTQKGRLTHLKHALLLPPRDMTRVHQMTFAHAKHLLASFEGVPCVVGATVFKVVAGLAWMVRDVKGGGRGEDEEEEDERRG